MIAAAARVLRIGGLVFAAGINRLAVFRDAFRAKLAGAADRAAFYRRLLHDGNYFPSSLEDGPSTVHLTTSEAFSAELSSAFTQLALVGAESFAAANQEPFHGLSDADADAWLDVIEQTGRLPEGLAYADHYLFIGRR